MGRARTGSGLASPPRWEPEQPRARSHPTPDGRNHPTPDASKPPHARHPTPDAAAAAHRPSLWARWSVETGVGVEGPTTDATAAPSGRRAECVGKGGVEGRSRGFNLEARSARVPPSVPHIMYIYIYIYIYPPPRPAAGAPSVWARRAWAARAGGAASTSRPGLSSSSLLSLQVLEGP